MTRLRSTFPEIGYLLFIGLFCTLGLARWAGFDFISNRIGDNWYDLSDSLFSATVIKLLINGDWAPFTVIKSASLAAPFGFQLGDFPSADQFLNSILWLLSRFTKNPYIVLNLFYLASFYVCALSFFYSARFLRIPNLLAAALATAFGLLPFHFFRYSHFYLAAYFMIPPLTALSVVLARNFAGLENVQRKCRVALFIATLVLAATCGVYYAFFFGLFFTVALLISSEEPGVNQRLKFYGLTIAILLIVGLSNFIPNFKFSSEFGKNPAVAARNIGDSERGGLRLATFLLPMNEYFIAGIGDKVREYRSVLPSVEGTQEYAGILAVLGIFLSLAALFRTRKTDARIIGLLSLSGILFATLGGLNILFGLFVTASFRSETRISVFLACFGLLALGFVAQPWFARRSLPMRLVISVALAITVLFDQIPVGQAGLAPATVDKQNDFNQFIASIESACAADSAILQMPFTQFPEAPSVGDMGPYEHLKAFLASQNLRWSFGAMRGRGANEIIGNLSRIPFDINELRRAGYAGIEVDLAGYPGPERESILKALELLKTKPLRSASGRYLFYAVPNSKCDH